jgi:hypothetical protein
MQTLELADQRPRREVGGGGGHVPPKTPLSKCLLSVTLFIYETAICPGPGSHHSASWAGQ